MAIQYKLINLFINQRYLSELQKMRDDDFFNMQIIQHRNSIPYAIVFHLSNFHLVTIQISESFDPSYIARMLNAVIKITAGL